MNNEIWKPIKGYEGVYLVSNTGRVKSVSRLVRTTPNGLEAKRTTKGKELHATDNGSGYKIVSLCNNGIRKNHYVHRLVAEAFIGIVPEGFVINHKDHNRGNNNVDNLEIVTQADNVKYSAHLIVKTKYELHKDRPNCCIAHRTKSYQVKVGSKYLGAYHSAEEARAARDKYCEAYLEERYGVLHDER